VVVFFLADLFIFDKSKQVHIYNIAPRGYVQRYDYNKKVLT